MAKEDAAAFDAIAQDASSVLPAPVLPKQSEGMGTKSPVFEAAYTRFMKDTFARDILHLHREEDDLHRTLTIAGARRLRLNKKTGRRCKRRTATVSFVLHLWCDPY